MNFILTYLQDILAPQLVKRGASSETIETVSGDIGARLISILIHWNDYEFRNTILFMGVEEATFYVPKASIELRSLVVVAIRNSLIEDMKSTITAANRMGLKRPIIDDNDIKIITQDAIEYFDKNGIDTIVSSLQGSAAQDNDPYIPLKQNYPLAWKAMEMLSQCQTYLQYQTNNSSPNQVLNIDSTKSSKLVVEVQSGMDPSIDSQLQQILSNIINGNQNFFFGDSFKMISRNPDKLFKIINTVLAANASLVTFNYYLSNGYVARRSTLLKPAHSTKDVSSKLLNTSGVRKSHLEILRLMRNKNE